MATPRRVPADHHRDPRRERRAPGCAARLAGGGGRLMARTADARRQTKETSIELALALDGSGVASATTGIPFFDHMLEQLGKHAGFDLTIRAQGDLEVDTHHTIEDVGIVLG